MKCEVLIVSKKVEKNREKRLIHWSSNYRHVISNTFSKLEKKSHRSQFRAKHHQPCPSNSSHLYIMLINTEKLKLIKRTSMSESTMTVLKHSGGPENEAFCAWALSRGYSLEDPWWDTCVEDVEVNFLKKKNGLKSEVPQVARTPPRVLICCTHLLEEIAKKELRPGWWLPHSPSLPLQKS